MIIWNIILTIIGILFLIADFWVCVHKKFSDLMGMGWSVLSIMIIMFSIVPGFSNWSRLMDRPECIAVFILFVVILFDAFLISMMISQLSMKNQELAMQVSLLNQENEKILYEIEEFKKTRNETIGR